MRGGREATSARAGGKNGTVEKRAKERRWEGWDGGVGGSKITVEVMWIEEEGRKRRRERSEGGVRNADGRQTRKGRAARKEQGGKKGEPKTGKGQQGVEQR